MIKETCSECHNKLMLISKLKEAGRKIAEAWLGKSEIIRPLHELSIDMEEAIHFACQVGLIEDRATDHEFIDGSE